MKIGKILSAFILLLLLPAGSRAGNGVERGTIDYSSNSNLPLSAQEFLNHIVFARCDLRGADNIEPAFISSSVEQRNGSNLIRHFRVVLNVKFKAERSKKPIFLDLSMTESMETEAYIQLIELFSPICR